MDPIKIPQNVYVEDRIIGSLTLRQIIIVIIGGGISYTLYAFAQKTYGNVGFSFMIFSAIPFLIALAFAFIRIHDLSLLKLILLLIERSSKPSIRTWGPRQGITIIIRTHATTPQKPPTHYESAEKIQQLSTLLDTLPDRPPEDTEEQDHTPVHPESIQVEPLTLSIDHPLNPAHSSISIFRPPSPNHGRS